MKLEKRKKLLVKIILLFVAILIAIGGVMYYAKTTMAPYTDPAYEEPYKQYIAAIEKDIKTLSPDMTYTTLDSIYVVVVHTLIFQHSAGLFPADSYDALLQTFINKYAPIYVDKSLYILQNVNWNKSELEGMVTRVDEICALRSIDSDLVLLNAETKKKLKEIIDVKTLYNSTSEAANASRYINLSDSEQKIVSANTYKNNKYIKNCNELVERLKKVPKRLSQAHYNYLSNRVNGLSNHNQFSTYEEFKDKKNAIEEEIEAYKKSKCYGNEKKETNSLNKKIEEYNDDAYVHLP